MVEPVKIPKSKAGLKRPIDKRHALLRIEEENVWITSRNRELAETFCTLVTRGDSVTVVKTAGVTVWGTYAGEAKKTGTIVLDRKPDGRFKLAPLDDTPYSLLEQVAHLVGRHGSVTSEEGHHGLIFRGELRNPGEPIENEATVQEPEPEVAPAKDKAAAETVKIPKSKGELKRPAEKHHAILRIEKENVWITSRNRELAETFCTLVTRGDPVTVVKTAGVIVWGTYAGEPEKIGTIVLDRKPDGRFKLVPLGITPNSLLADVAHFVGRHGSVTSEEGHHGLIFRGELRNPGAPIEPEATVQEPEPEVAPAKDEAAAETVKIPKSKGELNRPAEKHHALLRIEKENVWITSRDRELGETFCRLVTRGDPVTVVKTAGVIVWGTYAGEPESIGTIVLDRKPDGRFKLVPLGITPNSLLTDVAHFVGRHGSVTSEEGHHGLIFRGELRNPDEPIETVQKAEPEVAPAADAPTGEFEKVTGDDAVAAIGQKVTMEFLERGVKVRIRGKKAECAKTAKHILKGAPTVASEQGAKYMIEGNLSKSFLRKGANQEGPDANGVYTREDGSERCFTAFGKNLTAVQAACLTGCKKDTMFTVVVNDRSTGYVVISSGKRGML